MPTLTPPNSVGPLPLVRLCKRAFPQRATVRRMAFEPRTTPTRELLAVDAGSDVHELAELKRTSTASAAARPARASASAIRTAVIPAGHAPDDAAKTTMMFSAQILDRTMAGGTTKLASDSSTYR